MKIILSVFMFLNLLSDSGEEIVHKEFNQIDRTRFLDNLSQYTERSFTFAATGDILIHDYLYEDVETTDGYDFESRVESVAPYLQQQDLVFMNQETPIGGEALGLSGYPAFNAPEEVADLLSYFDADIVNFANNHTLDRGADGVIATAENLTERGIDYVGANVSREDMARDRIFNVNGIDVGFLAYTYGTNGIPVPEGQEYLVNIIDMQRIVSDIEALREKVDVLIVSYHQGVEYDDFPREEHIPEYRMMADAGADIIVGSHPHTLQPIEHYEKEDGTEAVIAYSMSNFFSAQQSLNTRLGGILEVNIEQSGGKTDIGAVRFMPTYVDSSGYEDFYLHPLADMEMDDVYGDVRAHMTSYSDRIDFVPYLD
ncbi:CapA family protein [Jeotgalicoccus saudimassiliensis]|uniref:CapA family protein n=1 Tax=Jeotgalicoccus saudimassiliensis TaxID=1461582 RepID=UPI000568AA3A|nr:CapA family protein [Jeotgalicoccus saudimassiliensis]